jgi:hypothetical protein
LAREPLGVGRHGWREHLDGDAPFQIRVGRPIHLAHSTHTDLGGDVIRPRREPGVRANDDVSIQAEPGAGTPDIVPAGALSRRVESPRIAECADRARARHRRRSVDDHVWGLLNYYTSAQLAEEILDA